MMSALLSEYRDNTQIDQVSLVRLRSIKKILERAPLKMRMDFYASILAPMRADIFIQEKYPESFKFHPQFEQIVYTSPAQQNIELAELCGASDEAIRLARREEAHSRRCGYAWLLFVEVFTIFSMNMVRTSDALKAHYPEFDLLAEAGISGVSR